ncbi:hypothetical protein [Bacillus kexueae]|uniref:hypothetical protein n=1 Tax=Aeribacillus kexueae TaxID=2078952 RepID=UPI001FB01D29|nr:hypothetical protein [Bacillus kexueae]
MDIKNYMEEIEYKLIHFSYELTTDIHQKIKTKVFYYQNQIETYVSKQIKWFINGLAIKPALKYVYTVQLSQLVQNKMKDIYQKHVLLKSI